MDPVAITREWIVDTLYGNVRPRLEGLTVFPVRHPRVADRVLYVIEVPKARTAHMANNSYYKRYELQSVPMEDYEVRDVMRRSDTPDVRLRIRNHPDPRTHEAFLDIRNLSQTPAPFFALSVYFTEGLNLARTNGVFEAGTVKWGGQWRTLLVRGERVQFHEWRYEWWRRIPLFQTNWEQIAFLGFSPIPEHGYALWITEGPQMRNKGAYQVRPNVLPYQLGPADDLEWGYPDE